MPGSLVAASRYTLIGDGIFSKLSNLAGFIPGGSAVAGITRLALSRGPRLPGAKSPGDYFREAIPNINPRTARNVSLGIAGAAGFGAAGLGAAGLGALTRTALSRGPATGLAARMGGSGAMSNIATALRGTTRMTSFGGGRRHRRMNTLNPKALRRATRRLAGFHHFAISTEKELRRLAPAHHAPAARHAHGKR